MIQRLAERTTANASLFLTFTMLFWAGNFTIGRWAAGTIPPVTLAALRWTGAALLILVFARRHLARDWPVIRANLPILLLLGMTGSGLFNTVQYIALTHTTAIGAGIINSTSPVMIAIMSYFVNGERATRRQMAGIAVSLVGVLVVLGKGDVATLARFAFNIGDLIMLGAMAVWALYTALLDKRPPINMVSFAAVTFVIAAVLNIPLSMIELASGAHIALGGTALLAVAYIAIFPSFLAYLLYNRGVEIIGPTRAGAFMHLVPLFTAVLAIVFLGEQFAAYHAVALAFILSGVWLAAR